MATGNNNSEHLQNVPIVQLPEDMTLRDLYPLKTEAQKREHWQAQGFEYVDGEVVLVNSEGNFTLPDWLK